MRVLVVQNFEGTGLGQIATALEEAGATVELVRADKSEALPSGADDHDAIVVLGGAQNALDDADFPYLPQLVALMRDFAERERSVLGVCLGGQLLARAYGASNLIGEAKEFGWREVALTEAGRADPLLSGLPERFPVFEWHDDTFTMPAGAVHLAQNADAPLQAFRIGRAAYGVQFHFEADRRLVREWTETFADYLARRQPHWPAIIDGEAARHGPAADAAGLAIARAWVGTIRPA